MKAGRRTARVAIGAVVAALALALGASTAGAQVGCNGSPNLCDRTLDRVVLPATHNSMSNAAGGWQIPNQQVGIPAQLEAGVRGFLIDIYYAHRGSDGKLVTDTTKQPGDQLYLCHVACSIGADTLDSQLRAVKRFLRDHPRNVLVFVNEDYTQPADFAIAVLTSGLRKRVYGGPLGPGHWPTLRTLIRARRQVIMLSQGGTGGYRWYHNAYAGLLQETPYNWETPNLLTDSANWPSSCVPNRGGRTGDLFLMNHWSPPVAPSPSTSASVNATNVLVSRARVCRFVRGRMPTLIAVDMFQSGGLFDAVRQLNADLN